MKYHRHPVSAVDTATVTDDQSPSRPFYIVGAGPHIHDMILLAREQAGFDLKGILDPSPALKGQSILDVPIVGWLDGIPHDIAAAIGSPSIPDSFDRAAVFHLLLGQGIQFPILWPREFTRPTGLSLSRGTVIHRGCRIGDSSVIGQNCLIGPDATIGPGTVVDDHTVLPPGTKFTGNEIVARPQFQPRSLPAVIADEHEPVQEIIRRMNWAAMEIMLITDADGALVGTVTDGDVRRGILAGIDMKTPAASIMNRSPVVASIGASHQAMLEAMRSRSIRHLPVVDANRRPVRLEILDNLVSSDGPSAVIMAGGLGARLRPLTHHTPKPLLSVGGTPILDHILTGLRKNGVDDVVISVNYLADHIKSHVGDGRRHDMNVAYLSEMNRLGTAGALSLLRPRPHKPFLVMNGDLLTKLNFAKLMDFQRRGNHMLVMCVRRHTVAIPYGVVTTDGDRVTSIREKPEHACFINAGIYVLDPRCLTYLPHGQRVDMPDLVSRIIEDGHNVGAFPIIEYWRDIGTPQDLRKASAEHSSHQHRVEQMGIAV